MHKASVLVSVLLLCTSPSVRAETYTLPGERSKPASEGLVTGQPGLRGIFVGHLPKEDGRPRRKVLLILFSNEKFKAGDYTLERIGVDGPNVRTITKGTWKLIQDDGRPGAEIYKLDAEAPARLRHFWAIDKSNLLVLNEGLKVWRSGPGDPFTVNYALYAKHCRAGQTLSDCKDE